MPFEVLKSVSPVFAVPAQFTAQSPLTGVTRTVLALTLVLAAVFLAARLLRRLRYFATGTAPSLQVLEQVSLGGRERAVLIQAGKLQWLVGVAAGNVRLIATVPLPDADTPAAPTGPVIPTTLLPKFSELMRRSLGR